MDLEMEERQRSEEHERESDEVGKIDMWGHGALGICLRHARQKNKGQTTPSGSGTDLNNRI